MINLECWATFLRDHIDGKQDVPDEKDLSFKNPLVTERFLKHLCSLEFVKDSTPVFNNMLQIFPQLAKDFPFDALNGFHNMNMNHL